jgi:hypothetical protein
MPSELQYDVFLSHNSKDKASARTGAKPLRRPDSPFASMKERIPSYA